MLEDMKNYVVSLTKKAKDSDNSHDAMRWSQAATNAANAMLSLAAIDKQAPLPKNPVK